MNKKENLCSQYRVKCGGKNQAYHLLQQMWDASSLIETQSNGEKASFSINALDNWVFLGK